MRDERPSRSRGGPSRRRPARGARGAGLLALTLAVSACGVGRWETAPAPAPVRSVHAALLRNGNVLLIAGSGNDPEMFAAGTFSTTEWNPANGTFRDVATPYDMFCSGHAFLPDGRLLVAGGTTGYPDTLTETDYKGSRQAYEYDPVTHAYTQVPDLDSGHWYPTLVSTGDGRMLAVAGQDENAVLQSQFQIFDPDANDGAGSWTPQQESSQFFPTYPALHLMADGRFLYSGVSTFGTGNIPPGFWDVGASAFTAVAGLTDPDRRDMGASVLLPPAQDQKVMVFGGGQHTDPDVIATDSTAIIDAKESTPTFVPGPPMSEGKQYVSAVILPDRTVLQTGGSNESWYDVDRADFRYRYTAQIFHPDTGTWEDAAKSKVGRTYHSEALLLPDGRVATFGGNASDQGEPFEMRIEIYTPEYFDAPRPEVTIGQSARWISRGQSFAFSSDKALRWVELVRPSSVTHSNDPEQRLVDVPFVQHNGSVTATVDPNPNLTPPGWYMLYGVDESGVPSIASWVHIA